MKQMFITEGSCYIDFIVAWCLPERGYSVSIFDNLERGLRRMFRL